MRNNLMSMISAQSIRRIIGVPALAVMAVMAATSLSPITAQAATFDVFLIAEQTNPTNPTDGAFSITADTGWLISDFTSTGFGNSISSATDISFDVTSPLTVNNKIDDDPTKPTDPGETGANSTSYMDGQISTWDNVGISGTTVDPDEQIDFGRNAPVTFNAAPGGFTDLVIAEVGGINPFILDICGDSSCSTYDRIFQGPTTLFDLNHNELIAMPEFASNDSGPESTLDQIWLFRFDEEVTDYIRIVEQDHRGTYTGARLQIDYIGTNAAISAVPVPAAVWLFGTALIGLVGFSKRKKAA